MRLLPRIEVTNTPGWHACVRGFGEARRVQLSTELLRDAPDSVVQAVIAHEHGHHILWHVETKLVVLMAVMFGLGYGVSTWNAWLVCALVLLTPLFWHGMVMAQEIAADKHATKIVGKESVSAMLNAMSRHVSSPAQKAAVLVRMQHVRGGV